MESKSNPLTSLETNVLDFLQSPEFVKTEEKGDRYRRIYLSSALQDSPSKFIVKVSKFNENDPNKRSCWVERMKTQNELLNTLTHPNLCQLTAYMFNNNDTTCEALVQDCGIPLLNLKIPKTGELVLKILLGSLSALEYIEKQGFSIPGINVESIAWDQESKTAKLTDCFSEKAFPKWALTAFDAVRSILPEYAAPEILPYCSDLQPKPEEFAVLNEGEPSLESQAVYSWAMTIYWFITGEFCINKDKFSQEKYKEFINSLDRIQLLDDPKGDYIKIIRPILKASLRFDKKSRPSFSAIQKIYSIADISLTEEKLGFLFENIPCELHKNEECSECKTIKNWLKEKNSLPDRVNPIIEENPSIFSHIIPNISQSNSNIVSDFQKIIKFMDSQASKINSLVTIETLIAMINEMLAHKLYEQAIEFTKKIIKLEDDTKYIDSLTFAELNSQLVKQFLPSSFKTTPVFYTLKEKKIHIDINDFLNFFKDLSILLLGKHQEILKIYPLCSTALLRAELPVWIYFISGKEDLAIEEIIKVRDKMKGIREQRGLNGLRNLMMYEIIGRLGFQFGIVKLKQEFINNLFEAYKIYFPIKICSQAKSLLEGIMFYLSKNNQDSLRCLKGFLESSQNDGNTSDRALGLYYLGQACLKEKKLDEAKMYFTSLVSMNVPEYAFEDLKMEAHFMIAQFLIDQQKYSLAYESAHKSYLLHTKRLPANHPKFAKILLYYYCTQRAKGMEAEAKKTLLKAVEMVKAGHIKDINDKTKVLFEVGNLYFRGKEYNQALLLYGDAMTAASKSIEKPEPWLGVKLFNNIANAARMLKQPLGGHYYSLSMMECKNAKDDRLSVKPRINYGTFCIEDNKIQEGLGHIIKAQEILLKNGKRESPEYKAIQNILSKVEGTSFNYKSTNRENIISTLLQNQSDNTLVLNEHESTIYQIIKDMKENQHDKSCEKCLTIILGYIKRALLFSPPKLSIDMNSVEYKQNVAVFANSALLMSMIGFEEENGMLVVKNPDEEEMKRIQKMLKALVSQF